MRRGGGDCWAFDVHPSRKLVLQKGTNGYVKDKKRSVFGLEWLRQEGGCVFRLFHRATFEIRSGF